MLRCGTGGIGRETRRTPETIEILDEGRQMRLRFTGRNVEWQRDDRWETLHSGRWESGLEAPGKP